MAIISKTDTTKKLEEAIFLATSKQGIFTCFEVTIGWFGKERVDYLTYDTKGVWRCYEVKSSKADFYSEHKKTFVGNFNYYVMTDDLYKQVKHDIPSHVGVYIYGLSKKRAKRQELKVDEQILKDSMIRSLSREFNKKFRSGMGLEIDAMNRKINYYKKEMEYYRRQYRDLRKKVQNKFGRRWEDELERGGS